MEKLALNVKGIMPSLVKQVADWFEVDVTIKLFGVKVFSFTWPPKADNPLNPQDDERAI